MQDYSPIPTPSVDDIDDIYCVMVNLILNTGLSLASKKAIKAKFKEFQKWRELGAEEIPFSAPHTQFTKVSEKNSKYNFNYNCKPPFPLSED